MDAVLIDPLAVDPARLDHDDRLRLFETIEHQRSALDAQQQLTLSLLADEDDSDASSKEWVRE
ncbi:MAG: hypothetical protein ABR571_08600 [Jatrophihabitans sp.]|uniref:hypothetical protein n=1 Tax=Jatrophihabitans sp. TaxID=1932789 RepID=UPI00390F85EB